MSEKKKKHAPMDRRTFMVMWFVSPIFIVGLTAFLSTLWNWVIE